MSMNLVADVYSRFRILSDVLLPFEGKGAVVLRNFVTHTLTA